MISQTTKKLDEEKLIISNKRTAIDEEISKNKTNFQELIDKYTDFLNEIMPTENFQ